MKIWIFNHYATQMYLDKAGRHYWFAKELQKMGHEVCIFCASTIHKNSEKIDTHGKRYETYYSDDIPFVMIDAPAYEGNGRSRVRNMVRFFFGLFRTARHEQKSTGKPDIIIASSPHPFTMIAGIRIAKRMNVPCICEIMDLWPEAIFAFGMVKQNGFIGRLLVRGEHWIYKKADALIFTKEGDTDYLKEQKWTTAQGGDISLEKCYYINIGVDVAAYEEQIEEKAFHDEDLEKENKFNVIYAGMIRPVNNVDNLLDCAKILAEDDAYQDIQILIFGEGSELERLRERARNENISNVKLKGFIPKNCIPYALSKASVNILNYAQNLYNWTRGNSSNKLFEYMASGKPIISTVQMGYSIINRYQCGVELEECTSEALAAEIKRFHDMSAEQLTQWGENARKGVDDFDVPVLAEKLIEALNATVHKDDSAMHHLG